MVEQNIFNFVLTFWWSIPLIVFLVLLFISAPYGRYKRNKGGKIPDAWGWVMMELPAVLVFGEMYRIGTYNQNVTALAFFLMWMAHYLQRAFIYPFLNRKSQRGMPFMIILLGAFFNLMNGYLNGRYIFEFSGGYPDNWIWDWRFLLGLVFFISGYIINRQADRVLRGLRESEGKDYKIPRGFIACKGIDINGT